jgi:Fe-S-cluster containining protein
MESICLNCVASCCKLVVEIDKIDYNKLVGLGHKDIMTKQSEIFIRNNPSYKIKEKFLDEKLYVNNFAIIGKGKDGFCKLLDRETRLCTIYENIPKTCSEFSNESLTCKNIKVCIN